MDFDLDNKVVLVTGSSAGIGRAIALAFAREKARVVITFCAHQTEGQNTADRVRAQGASPLLLHYDLANDGSTADGLCDPQRDRWIREQAPSTYHVLLGCGNLGAGPVLPVATVRPDQDSSDRRAKTMFLDDS
jgi:NAD(P)-dependent dehydrogenase (short-subunit alcohol dehydrogenase family)